MSMKTTFTIDEIMDALAFVGDNESADSFVAVLLDTSLDKLWAMKELYMTAISDKLQLYVSTLDTDAIEDFCGFKLDGISKKDAIYQVMTQMPDEVLLNYYHKYFD